MLINPQAVGLVGRPRQHCPKFNKINAFKNIAKSALHQLSHIVFPQGRKWTAEDIVTVLAYAWIRGVSPDHASNKIDRWVFEHHPYLFRVFSDGRHARAAPHQTTVNDWLRCLSVHDAEALSKAVFEAYLRRFFNRKKCSRRIVLEFDLTYLGYWGKRRDKYIKGSRMVKGTRRIRHYHGALIHGAGVSLYVAMQHVSKGQSKIPFMIDTAVWLQQLGFEIKWCVVDREYYRHSVLEGFKKLGIDVITPAKDYDQLKAAKVDYLTGHKGRIQQYSLSQGSRKGRRAKKIRCFLVLLARGKQRLDRIKNDYRQGKKTLYEAMDQLYGLITARAPQYAGSRFPRLVRRIYKMRWQIETAFRDNEIHKAIGRSNYDGTRFIGEMGRYLLFNAWQESRVDDPRGDKLTFQIFRDELVDGLSGSTNL